VKKLKKPRKLLSFLRTNRLTSRVMFALFAVIATLFASAAGISAYGHDWHTTHTLAIAAYLVVRISYAFTVNWSNKNLVAPVVIDLLVVLTVGGTATISTWLYLEPTDVLFEIVPLAIVAAMSITAMLRLGNSDAPLGASFMYWYLGARIVGYGFPMMSLAELVWYDMFHQTITLIGVALVATGQTNTWKQGRFANAPKPPKQNEEETQPEADATS
jgi:hypothetical protein